MHSSPTGPAGPAVLQAVFFDAEGTLWVPRAGRGFADFWRDPTPANARACFRVTPGIRTLLARLKERGLRLVVLSKHHPAILPSLLREFDLARHFEDVLVNGDKGDRAACWLAAQGIPAHAALMVGDREDLDVTPLKRRGIEALLLDRPYNRTSDAPRVADPRELLARLPPGGTRTFAKRK